MRKCQTNFIILENSVNGPVSPTENMAKLKNCMGKSCTLMTEFISMRQDYLCIQKKNISSLKIAFLTFT